MIEKEKVHIETNNKMYNMNDMKKISVFGISIGGTKTAITHAFFDSAFSNIEKEVFPTFTDNPEEEMKQIFSFIDNFNYKVDIISIIVGGPLDINKGLLLKPPHLQGYDNYPIVDILKARYKVEVYMLNDADACALAEHKFGAGRGYKNMAYLTFGTGFGSGLILNNNLYTGFNGMAGEIGHVRLSESGPIGYGKTGSVEGFIAGGNIPLWAKEYIDNKETALRNYKELTTKDIATEARRGDKVALEIFDIVAKRLGEAISILIDILNLDLVAVGGIYPRCLDLLENKVLDSVKNNAVRNNFEACKIVPSKLGEKIDDYSSLMGIMLGDNMKSFYERYPKLMEQKNYIEEAINILENCVKNNGKILVCGNGGSSADAAHITGELMKQFIYRKPLKNDVFAKINTEFDEKTAKNLQLGIPCIDLTSQTALITAYANDVDPELIYAQQVVGYSQNNPNDVLIALSTSGNSKNVVNAVKAAKSLGLRTVSLTGKNESELSRLSTVTIKAPEEETYTVQECHLPIYHYICMELEKRIE